MELQRKKQIIENDGERQEDTKAQNVTNALFVGSTAELLKLVKKETKDKKGKFLVLDLEIEGISLVSTHKAETMSILRKNKGDFNEYIDFRNFNEKTIRLK